MGGLVGWLVGWLVNNEGELLSLSRPMLQRFYRMLGPSASRLADSLCDKPTFGKQAKLLQTDYY